MRPRRRSARQRYGRPIVSRAKRGWDLGPCYRSTATGHAPDGGLGRATRRSRDHLVAEGFAVESICAATTSEGCRVAARTSRSWKQPGPHVADRTMTDAGVIDALLATQGPLSGSAGEGADGADAPPWPGRVAPFRRPAHARLRPERRSVEQEGQHHHAGPGRQPARTGLGTCSSGTPPPRPRNQRWVADSTSSAQSRAGCT